MPKLTVISAIYKVEPYLRKCLDNLVDQTLRDMEIILVDDGSPDRCGEICDEYAVADPRIKVIHKENGGLSSAWNCGLDQATGDWVAFCDPDDWVETNYYETLFALMGEEDVDIFFENGNYIEYPDNTSKEVHSFCEAIDVSAGAKMVPLVIQALVFNATQQEFLRDYGVVWDKLYRRSFLKENGLHFPTSVVAKCAWLDAEFTFEAVCKAKHVRSCLYTGYHYRIVALSANRRYNAMMPEAYMAFFHEIDEIARNYAGGAHSFDRQCAQRLFMLLQIVCGVASFIQTIGMTGILS